MFEKVPPSSRMLAHRTSKPGCFAFTLEIHSSFGGVMKRTRSTSLLKVELVTADIVGLDVCMRVACEGQCIDLSMWLEVTTRRC